MDHGANGYRSPGPTELSGVLLPALARQTRGVLPGRHAGTFLEIASCSFLKEPQASNHDGSELANEYLVPRLNSCNSSLTLTQPPPLFAQDLRSLMEAQYVEISRWKEFSLESTCDLLRKKFPSAAVWIVRPSRMLRNLFSSFHNFVESSITGVPEYSSTPCAIPQLVQLLRNAIQQVHAAGSGGMKKSPQELFSLPVVLVGFSKGCVVLNQIVHELANYVSPAPGSTDTPPANRSPLSPSLVPHGKQILRDFVKRVTAFYWLDAGHSGDHGAWVTDDELLKVLAALRVEIHVHVTPHQVMCPQRPWIGEEKCEFVAKLQQFGATVKETLHFEQDASLEKHFKVLQVFEAV